MRHTGALFVSNPRRRKTIKRRKNLTKAAFVAKMDLNKWAVGKKEIAKYKARKDLNKLFTKYGGAKAKAELRQIQRGHVSGFFDEKLGYGPAKGKYKYTRPKGYGSRAYRKKVRGRTGVEQPKPKQAMKMYSGKATTGARKTRAKARSAARKGLSAYNVFQKEHAGKGWSSKKMGKEYQKMLAGRGGFIGPMQRTKSGKSDYQSRVMQAAAQYRREGHSASRAMKLAHAAAKRGGPMYARGTGTTAAHVERGAMYTKDGFLKKKYGGPGVGGGNGKGKKKSSKRPVIHRPGRIVANRRRRKNALAYKTNKGWHKKGYKKNALAVRMNPNLGAELTQGSAQSGILSTVTSGRFLETAAVQIGAFGLSYGTHIAVSSAVLPMISDALPMVSPVTDYLTDGPFGQTVQGGLAAVLLNKFVVSKMGGGKVRDFAKAYTVALVTVPLVLDSIALYDMYFGGALDIIGNGNGNGMEAGALAYGDGGAYILAGLDEDTQSILAEYNDATLADAQYSGLDFDGVEGQTMLAGPRVWRRRFGHPVKVTSRKASWFSRHAGQHGHRWGWLIKLVGFENARKIAALKPKKRMEVIKALKEQALTNVQSLIAQHQQAHQIEGEASALAVEGAANGTTGAYGAGGYGALLYSGGTP